MEQVELNDLERQFFLYSKGWYVKSGNVLTDLRKIQSAYSGVQIDFIYESHVWDTLIELGLKIFETRLIREFMFRAVGLGPVYASKMNIMENFISLLSVTKVTGISNVCYKETDILEFIRN